MKLRQIREQKGLTQQELEALSGVNQATISGIETGASSTRVNTLRKLAAALGVSPGDLLGDEDSPPAADDTAAA